MIWKLQWGSSKISTLHSNSVTHEYWKKKHGIPDRGFKECGFNKQLSNFTERKEIKNIFRELKYIRQLWGSKKSNSKALE